MNKLLTTILLTSSLVSFGQVDNNRKLIDSLKYVTVMPYICEQEGTVGCGDKIFWDVVTQKLRIAPSLLRSLNDTTETKATVPNFGGQYTVGDICYLALQEIIHGIPTLDIAGVKFDSEGCGYCSFWNYIRQPTNRAVFTKQVTKWYNENIQNVVWVANNKYEVCDCSGKHPNKGHYELKKSQDSVVVFQQGAALFSNSYIFYPSSPTSDDYYDGTFKHYYETDDAQTWYGQGTYTDKGKKRMLRFGDPDLTTKVEFGKIHYEANFQRTLKISGKRFLSKDYYGTTRKKNVIFVERNDKQ